MREEMMCDIPISPELKSRVEQTLQEVQRIHRRKLLRRAGGIVGSFVAVVGILFTMAAVNPVLASHIPLIGDWLGSLFYDAAHDSKPGTGGTFLETYGLLEDVNAAADSGPWTMSVDQGYTDGENIQLSLSITGPQEDLSRFTSIQVEGYGLSGASAAVNGEEATIEGVNSFEERDGTWATTMEIAVPEGQHDAETLEIDVTIGRLLGIIAQEKGQNEGNSREQGGQGSAGGVYSTEIASGDFSFHFSLSVDREHSFSFLCDAEENGARVLSVSGTPTQTIITVEKPFWGLMDSIVETEILTQGYPVLVLPDKTELKCDFDRSEHLGGYDHQLQAAQTASLYFDGIPNEVQQVVLRFYESGSSDTILAEFLIDLSSEEVRAGE